MERVAVVHLVRQANGLEVFQSFLRSYREHEPGAEHELVLLCKGFESPDAFGPFEQTLAEVPHSRLFVSDTGFDIGAYRQALQQTDFEYYCLLNSFSTILAPQWLAKMRRCWRLANVGLVGATGSYESTSENLRQEIRAMRGLFRRSRLRALVRLFRLRRDYPGFPNPTLRTNAFAARGDLLRQLLPDRVETKEDALRFESGRHSLTRQVRSRGLDVLVVGRNGQGYSPETWPTSGTFRQGGQTNLLVADNQTERYARASREERQWLARMAWGPTAYSDQRNEPEAGDRVA